MRCTASRASSARFLRCRDEAEEAAEAEQEREDMEAAEGVGEEGEGW